MSTRRSIPTRYKGHLFRSKLEADWARTFDYLGVVWEYEPEGRYFGDVFFYPDFYLPRSRQWVEVKGVFEPYDCKKIQALLRHVEPRPHTDEESCPDMAIVACLPDGVFYGWERGQSVHAPWSEFLTTAARPVELYQCTRCTGWWFLDAYMSWQCQCCGSYDGDSYVGARITSPLGDTAAWLPRFERDALLPDTVFG